MKHHWKLSSLLAVLLIFTVPCCFAQRLQYSINEGWRFSTANINRSEKTDFNDNGWETVNLPHTWNHDLDDESPDYLQTTGGYRKTLPTDPNLKGKRIYLRFEGVSQVADVYFNGRHKTTHKGAYTAFNVDVTNEYDFSKPAQLITVHADNRQKEDVAPYDRNLFPIFGGIYRDVYLIATQPVHFDMLNYGSPGVFIETPNVSERNADITVRGKVVNESNSIRPVEIQIVIKDKAFNEVKTFSAKETIGAGEKAFSIKSNLANPKLWSPDEPYLYQVQVKITDAATRQVLDEIVQPLGFRWFRFDAQNGFFLNGKHLKLTGANRHQDFKNIGYALTDDQHFRDMQLMKEMGANFIRLAHYPQDPAVLEACDRLGLLVWEETPSTPIISLAPGYGENALLQQKEMVRQHFNHPSIILWGYMNEVLNGYKLDKHDSLVYFPRTVALAKSIDSLTRAEDPHRYTTMAFEHQPYYHSSGLFEVPMVVSWNKYYGWYYGKFADIETFLDNEHRLYPNRPMLISEYGAASDVRLHSAEPVMADHSIEWQLDFTEAHLKAFYKRPYVAGSLMWNGFDFHHVAGWATPNFNTKGILTIDRQKKDVYYLFQAYMLKKPFTKIASTNYTIRGGFPAKATDHFVKQEVRVYSNQPKVRLYNNGVLVAEKTVQDKVAKFDVPFVNGLNRLSTQSPDGKTTDLLDVHFKLIPYHLSSADFNEIGINVGSNCTYRDGKSDYLWLADQPYTKGSYGYIGGRRFYRWNFIWIGAEGDYSETTEDALYHTAQDSIAAYRFDVADGDYELELVFAEQYKDENNKRTLDISINGVPFVKDFNIAREAGGPWRPLHKKIAVKATGGNGIQVDFAAKNGHTTLNAIRLRRM